MADKKNRSVEDKQKELEELLEISLEQIRSYYAKPEEMKEFADFMSKIHNNSTTNLSLIKDQFDGAIAVASYGEWKKHGFHLIRVKKV